MKQYPSYKPSGNEWIGEIPQNWTSTRLDKVSYVLDPQPDHRAPEIVDDGFPYVGIRDINDDGTINCETTRKVSLKAIEKQEASFRIDDNDIVFCKVGTLGEPRFLKLPDTRLALSATLVLVKPNEVVSPSYLRFILESSFMISQMHACVTGSTRPALGIQQIRRFVIPLASLKEQQAIAAYLDAKTKLIDDTIAKKQQLIQLLQEERTAMINEAVNRGLDPHVKLKSSGTEWLGEVPKHWEVKKLKYLIKELESGVSVNSSDQEVSNNQKGILKTSCVYTYSFRPSENKKVNNNEIERLACPVRGDSIIISRMNTPELVGASGYVAKDYPNLYLPDRLWQTVFFNKRPNVLWLSFVLINSRFREVLSFLATGTSSSMKNLSKEDLLGIEIGYPPVEEQNQIVGFIEGQSSKINVTIKTIQKEIVLLQEYRTATINEVITGKVCIL